MSRSFVVWPQAQKWGMAKTTNPVKEATAVSRGSLSRARDSDRRPKASVPGSGQDGSGQRLYIRWIGPAFLA